jgi:hypothetical protein
MMLVLGVCLVMMLDDNVIFFEKGSVVHISINRITLHCIVFISTHFLHYDET